LRTAAERGLSGIALTDFDHTAGFEHALATADRLKREGILPEDFIVIRGEQVHTPSGALIALFIHDRVQRGMTMKAAIRDIHEQGGIAILADPGIESGPKLVRTLPLDGYLLRTEPGSVFRTLELMGDMGLDKPLLSASGARTHSMVGLPYTIVETSDRSIEGVRQAFRDKTVFGDEGAEATGVRQRGDPLVVRRGPPLNARACARPRRDQRHHRRAIRANAVARH
jgi:hypothetical protein